MITAHTTRAAWLEQQAAELERVPNALYRARANELRVEAARLRAATRTADQVAADIAASRARVEGE